MDSEVVGEETLDLIPVTVVVSMVSVVSVMSVVTMVSMMIVVAVALLSLSEEHAFITLNWLWWWSHEHIMDVHEESVDLVHDVVMVVEVELWELDNSELVKSGNNTNNGRKSDNTKEDWNEGDWLWHVLVDLEVIKRHLWHTHIHHVLSHFLLSPSSPLFESLIHSLESLKFLETKVHLHWLLVKLHIHKLHFYIKRN